MNYPVSIIFVHTTYVEFGLFPEKNIRVKRVAGVSGLAFSAGQWEMDS